ncbi:MAG TPA: Hsp20/alpha crystallin family protein [Rhodanobacteraceae bacterium]
MRGDEYIDVMWAEALTAIAHAERLQRQFCAPTVVPRRRVSWTPPMDVFEGADEFVVQVVLPDVDPAQIECALDSHVLIIAGERRRPTLPAGVAIRRMEIPCGRFECRLAIAAYAITSRTLSNGCLTVVLAK